MPHVFGARCDKQPDEDTPWQDNELAPFASAEGVSKPTVSTRGAAVRQKRRSDNCDNNGIKPKRAAFDRIVDLSTVRDRSQQELAERLEREGYAEGEVQEALERAVNCGLVDDMRFAEALVRSRVSAGKGETAIRRDLAQHGIDVDSIVGWPDEFGLSGASQVKKAVEYLECHPPKSKDVYGSAFRKLQTRGYPKNVASQAVRTWYEGS